jgi:hypothetical protein
MTYPDRRSVSTSVPQCVLLIAEMCVDPGIRDWGHSFMLREIQQITGKAE